MRTAVLVPIAALFLGCGKGEEATHTPPSATPAPEAAAPKASERHEKAASTAAAAASEPREKSAKTEPAASGDLKAAATPFFWQMDPAAKFPNGGADYCAPVSVSNGLLYLAKARHVAGIAASEDEKGQIALVDELAKDLATDPKEGTSADQIVTGIRRFAEAHKLGVKRLEVATWRPLSKENTAHLVGQKPSLEWLRKAANDPDTVVFANFGWYKKDAKGYARNNGHWVDVVGASTSSPELEIRNSLLKPEDQKAKKNISLTELDKKFERVDGKTVANMAGYYKAEGPALPFGGSTVAAVLDAVIVFERAK